MLEQYELQNLEQLRAVADILRMRIVDTLRERPMTVTQLGDALGIAPAKVHYHVRELEKVGLLRLVETREKGGILEKYYQPIARDFAVPKELLLSAPPDELLATTNGWFEQIKTGFQRALRKMLEQKMQEPDATLAFAPLYLTREEQGKLSKQIEELLRPYALQRSIEGERVMQMMFAMYPQDNAEETNGLSTSETSLPDGVQVQSDNWNKGNKHDKEDEEIPDMTQLKKGAGIVLSTSPTFSTWVAGVISYNRARLEKTLVQGRRLRVSIVGICTFEDDVSADLVDRAIEQFTLVGKLQASPAVREVLQRKRTAGA